MNRQCHTSIITYEDDTVLMALISNNKEQAYLNLLKDVAQWFQFNNLILNISIKLIGECRAAGCLP